MIQLNYDSASLLASNTLNRVPFYLHCGEGVSVRSLCSVSKLKQWRENLPYYILAFLFGIIAGLRAFTPIAAVCWAARLGKLHLEGTSLAFLGYVATPYIFTLLALSELVTDKLPKTPSRKVPFQFGGRIFTGALSGAAVGAAAQSLVAGLLLGAVGAIIGTLGGAAVRARLAATFKRDLPAALLEDAVAVIGVIVLVSAL